MVAARYSLFQLQRGVFKTSSTPNLKGVQICFHRHIGVGGVFLMSFPYNITINSLILLRSMILNGVILTFKRENARNTGAEGVYLLKSVAGSL